MLVIKSKKLNYGINFPTELNEITPEVLTTLTKDVKLPKHHCIVALCFRTKLFEFVAAMRNSSGKDMSITPLLAKISDNDAQEMNVAVGDKLVMDRSSIERGVHLPIKTLCSTQHAYNYLEKDPNLSKAIMTGESDMSIVDSKMNKSLIPANSPYIYIINFKVIPITNIYGGIPVDSSVQDPFLYKEVVSLT